MTTEQQQQTPEQIEAEKLRVEGNEFFKHSKFMDAIEKYTAAIEKCPSVSLYLNRAMSALKVSYAGEALSDAEEALKLEPNNPKAVYRKGVAYLQMTKLKEALNEFRLLIKLVPTDTDAKERLASCEKEYKRILFLKAIESADTIAPSRKFKPETMPIPATYAGPRLELDQPLTADYVAAMAKLYKEEGLIPLRDACQIIIRAIQVLKELPNVVPVKYGPEDTIIVCGDTHGQFYDTLHIFDMFGYPSETNRYLFNGDFVDRGSYSVENVMVFLAYKALYPQHFFMSRGNHEGLMMNRMYGFEGEVRHKYNDYVFDLLQEAFHSLPLAHILNDKVYVTHGGLFSRDDVMIPELQKIDRFRDVPSEGLMCEMLWADPMAGNGRGKSKRGTGLDFGPDVTKNFLELNNLELVVRSHEVNQEGFVELHNGKLVTVFSAPNYCDQVGNKGAVLKFKGSQGSKYEVVKFSAVVHPGKKPMAYAPRGLLGF